MRAEPTAIPGCVLVRLTGFEDDRGDFLKVFRRDAFAELGLDPTVAEVYWSTSRRGVVRGLHFQTPPHEHAKTVNVVRGAVHDVVVDLRVGSPMYGQPVVFPLRADDPSALHVPAGCAHGFQALADDTVVAYLVGTEHAPDHDTGIRWDSVDADWPLADVVISDRDAGFPALADFASPFVLAGRGGRFAGVSTEAAEPARHRKAVGPPERFDLIAGLQFSLLFALGLRERHRLLDIGCGSLRSGRLFIPYLAPGHYYGIEPDESLVRSGLETELGAGTAELKQPHFLFRDDFAFGEFGTQFDFMVAQSILSHTHLDLARTLFRNARATIAPGGVFCGTFFLRRPVTGAHVHRPRGTKGTGWVGMGGVGYTWKEFAGLAGDARFAVRRLHYPHPRQTWFVAVPDTEAARLPDLARRAESWKELARELPRAEPLQTRNTRLYLAQRRWAVLRERLRR